MYYIVYIHNPHRSIDYLPYTEAGEYEFSKAAEKMINKEIKRHGSNFCFVGLHNENDEIIGKFNEADFN